MEKESPDLKWERQKRNISLDKIAADTRISLRHLQSIEEGRFNDLPGGVYGRAFIKAYCESLNLDPEEMLKRYEQLQPPVQSEMEAKAIIPLPEPDAFSLRAPVIIWGLILVAAVLGGYLGRGWIADTFSSYFSQEEETPENISSPVENPPAVDSPRAEANLQKPASSPEDLSAENTPRETMPPVSQDSAVTHPLAETVSPPAMIPDGMHFSDARIRVELEATESCWISVAVDGAPSVAKLMLPGESELFFADESARIRIGNAGGINMKINDRPTRALGGPGEVVSMDINPDNIEKFTD